MITGSLFDGKQRNFTLKRPLKVKDAAMNGGLRLGWFACKAILNL